MSEAHDNDLRRLTEALRQMATVAESPEQVTEAMKAHLREVGLNPEWVKP